MYHLPPRDQRLPELQAVLDALGHELRERRFGLPALVAACDAISGEVVAGHKVAVEWFPFGYGGSDEEDPDPEELALSISGPRLKAGWLVRPEELRAVFRGGLS